MSKSLLESTALSTVTNDSTIHPLVAVTTGTNFAAGAVSAEVRTLLALRVGGDTPVAIKGVKDGERFVGFELLLSGPETAEQLIYALESAAATLRAQAGLARAAAQEPADDAAPDAGPDVASLEAEVAQVLASYGTERLPLGQTVAAYLVTELGENLRETGPASEIWQVCLAALREREPLTLALVRERVGDDAQHVLAGCPPDLLDKWSQFPALADQLQLECDALLTRLGLAYLFERRTALLHELADPNLAGGVRRARQRQFRENAHLEYKFTRLLAIELD